MKHIIKLIRWSTTYGDGCCDDWGTRLVINDQIVSNDFLYNVEIVEDIIKALGIIDYEITEEDAE
jgi:hypothetical protein